MNYKTIRITWDISHLYTFNTIKKFKKHFNNVPLSLTDIPYQDVN